MAEPSFVYFASDTNVPTTEGENQVRTAQIVTPKAVGLTRDDKTKVFVSSYSVAHLMPATTEGFTVITFIQGEVMVVEGDPGSIASLIFSDILF